MNKKKQYDWIVIGSGIAGVIAAEILTREGHSTLLIEKNEKLASETTRDFHEWMHTGSLFTLIPDKLKTLKFILGALDDLLEFYGSYKRMNLIPTMKGIKIDGREKGWFINNYIRFKFRIKNRKITFPWMIGVARSLFLIEKIKQHDWLRRRAGVLDPFRYTLKDLFIIIKNLYKTKEKFYTIQTSDFTMNSRLIIKDMIATSVIKGLDVTTSNRFIRYEKNNEGYIVHCEKGKYSANHIVLCNGENSSEFINARIKKSYAPMAVVNNLSATAKSFVELDYYPKNCINIITKEEGIGLVGGISFSNKEKCNDYIEKVLDKHRQYEPSMKKLHTYIGTKSEVIIEGEPRNYLYHILQIEKGIWMIIPGKFSLGFSIGPEFYRKVYGKNPKKYFETEIDQGKDDLVSNTVWEDYLKK